ncbi:ZINC/IRON TRANSPORTER [Salix purpurea]|uniref:ZINC/IRON TRANSPORTER n=1 Tax=Salix purpurea TaxID=77065 RepID=A0A9Q0NNJ1_SALPP|nr:ZINC/IRON TRANSPORTER [Salix purpurea]
MATSNPKLVIISIFFIILSFLTLQAESAEKEGCVEEENSCHDKARALPLKIIAIVSILVSSVIGVSAPLFTRSIPALHPDKSLFVIVKAFAAGIILGTGFMHVLPDSFDMLSSSCLPENPWHKFPFTGFGAMLSAIVTLMVDALATSLYSKKANDGVIKPESNSHGAETDQEMAAGHFHGHGHGHGHHYEAKLDGGATQLLRYRVIAMVRFLDFVYSSIIYTHLD